MRCFPSRIKKKMFQILYVYFSLINDLFVYLQVVAFVAALESRKITVSVRQTRGLDANAACGQLRNQFQKDPLVADSDSNRSDESAVAMAC